MTDPPRPEGSDPERPRPSGVEAEDTEPDAEDPHPAEDGQQHPPEPRRRRRTRRAVRPGTRTGADESPDLTSPPDAPAPGESERDRWLREQRPPHWETT